MREPTESEHVTEDPRLADPEFAAEQEFLDRVYSRLDGMRRSASRVAEAYDEVGRGGTHQARLERDIALENTHRRLAVLDVGQAPLAFGRIDREIGGRPLYVGRLAVDDDEGDPLVIDWRAPVAEPFYRATPIDPMGILRRRHLLTKNGRELVGLDDEVFDATRADELGLIVKGEGALMRALDRERTGRMDDIVATIQGEQDAAVRAALPGVLVVSGGPGTGKTAVALHRAAYLLYTYRHRLASQGVLVVGPSSVFLRYIEQVLPSLGEHEVQLATIGGLKPSLRLEQEESYEASALKGDLRMAQVLARALSDRERAPRSDTLMTIDGLRLVMRRGKVAAILDRIRRRRGAHNAKRLAVERSIMDNLYARYRTALIAAHDGVMSHDDSDLDDDSGHDAAIAAALARGEAAPREWESNIRRRIRRLPEVRMLLDRIWPVITGAELVHDLFSFEPLVRSAGEGVLSKREQSFLLRERSINLRAVRWSEADVALVDEADALVGPIELAFPRISRRRGAEDREMLEAATTVISEHGLDNYTNAADVVARYRGDGDSGGVIEVPELRTFGHVIVDEAQDLTPMQWRMLARRAPNGSMTLVGDFGQASRAGAASGWDAVLKLLVQREESRLVTLSVNYRTPAEIMELANRLLAVVAPDVEPTRAVRSSGENPRIISTQDVFADAVAETRVAAARGGSVAVIAPREMRADLADALSDVGAVADVPEVLDAPIAIVSPTAAKGLEFDHVVVVEPVDLVGDDLSGLRLLYVTLSRATRSLTVLHAKALPDALAVTAGSGPSSVASSLSNS